MSYFKRLLSRSPPASNLEDVSNSKERKEPEAPPLPSLQPHAQPVTDGRARSFFEVDQSHIEIDKAKTVLSRLLEVHQRAKKPPKVIQRSNSLAFEGVSLARSAANQKRRAKFASDIDRIQAPTKHEETIEPKKAPGIIDDIRIVKKLGKGSFGTVWKAENTKTGENIAIKKVIGSSFREQASFLKEAEILQMSNHPNVLRFVGLFIKQGEFVDEHNPSSVDLDALYLNNQSVEGSSDLSKIRRAKSEKVSIYLCTEYCRGGDLTHLLRNKEIKEIPWNVRLRLALDIVKGLKYLHSQKIVHRDIKGENVLLQPVKKTNWTKNVETALLQQSIKRDKRRGKARGLGLKLGDEDKKFHSEGSARKTRTRLLPFKIPKPISIRKKRPNVPPRPSKRRTKDVSFSERSDRKKTVESLSKLFPNLFVNDLECEVEADVERPLKTHISRQTITSARSHQTSKSARQDEDGNSLASYDYDSDDTNFKFIPSKREKMLLSSRAILADVGLARFFNTNTTNLPASAALKALNTERMTIRGTPWTMAPELIANSKKNHYTTACDIYSLGIVFLELSLRLTPEPQYIPRKDDITPDFDAIDKMPVEPFRMEGDESVSRISNTEDISFRETCPEGFRDLCMACCAADPIKRPTAKKIAKKLNELVRQNYYLERLNS